MAMSSSVGQRMTIRRVNRAPKCYTCSLAGIGDLAELERYDPGLLQRRTKYVEKKTRNL